jgi:hypothetical protein
MVFVVDFFLSELCLYIQFCILLICDYYAISKYSGGVKRERGEKYFGVMMIDGEVGDGVLHRNDRKNNDYERIVTRLFSSYTLLSIFLISFIFIVTLFMHFSKTTSFNRFIILTAPEV